MASSNCIRCTDVSGDQRWKATMVFTDLSVSIATLNAALAAKYGI